MFHNRCNIQFCNDIHVKLKWTNSDCLKGRRQQKLLYFVQLLKGVDRYFSEYLFLKKHVMIRNKWACYGKSHIQINSFHFLFYFFKDVIVNLSIEILKRSKFRIIIICILLIKENYNKFTTVIKLSKVFSGIIPNSIAISCFLLSNLAQIN